MAAVIQWAVAHPWAAAPLAVAGWGLFVLASPYRECRWCRDKPGGRPRCWRCGGTRLSRRPGAKLAHKAKLSLQQAWEEREWRR